MTGYSGTPLVRKLGIKAHHRVLTIDAPPGYRELLGTVPEGVAFLEPPARTADITHLFVKRRADLEKGLRRYRRTMAGPAILWVSWPKKASGMATDVTEDVIRAVALPLGFVDVKVCAVDHIWSGLKLVIRRTERPRTARA